MPGASPPPQPQRRNPARAGFCSCFCHPLLAGAAARASPLEQRRRDAGSHLTRLPACVRQPVGAGPGGFPGAARRRQAGRHHRRGRLPRQVAKGRAQPVCALAGGALALPAHAAQDAPDQPGALHLLSLHCSHRACHTTLSVESAWLWLGLCWGSTCAACTLGPSPLRNPRACDETRMPSVCNCCQDCNRRSARNSRRRRATASATWTASSTTTLSAASSPSGQRSSRRSGPSSTRAASSRHRLPSPPHTRSSQHAGGCETHLHAADPRLLLCLGHSSLWLRRGHAWQRAHGASCATHKPGTLDASPPSFIAPAAMVKCRATHKRCVVLVASRMTVLRTCQ